MELKEGMLIRTKEGIRKIIDIYDDNYLGRMYELNRNLHYRYPEGHCLFEEDLKGDDPIEIKASFNIIDLIEEGDYVNGFEVLRIDKECDLYPKTLKCQYPNNTDYFDIFNEDIKFVITKEQFESMKYEVK